MKRLISFVLVSVMVISMLSINVFAVQNAENADEITYFDDGSYILISISDTGSRATSTKNGSKTYTYYNSDDVKQWQAVLSGTFTYTGTSSTCTAASCSVSIYDSSWYVISKYASRSGNTASASASVGEKVLGVTVMKIPVSLKLSCDANGKLS